MEKRKGNSLKIGTKITIWIIVVILIIGGAVSALMYTAYADGQMELTGLSASRVVATAGAQIDGDQIERYTKTLQKDGDYAALFELLSETKSISQFEYLYIIADLTPEHFTYIASGSDDKKLENEPLKMGDTDERSIFGSELGETLSKGIDTLTEPLSYGEEYGNALMLSAFYPIKNSQGKVVAALGADVNVDTFMEEVSRKMVGVFLTIAAIIVGISIAVYIISAFFIRKIVTKPLSTLSSAAQSIADGNLDIKITHKANDEMGDVIDAFMSVIETLGVLRQGAVELRESATRGHILHRLPDNPKIKGAYQEIVNGMHGIMDTFIEHLHALPIGIGVMDKEYHTLFCNHAMAQIGGLSADNLNGKKCSEFLSSDKCNTEECPGRHTLSKGERCLKDVITGSLDFEIQTAPIKGMDGQIEGFLEVAIDQTITMQNQREAARQAQAVAAQIEVSQKQAAYQAAEVEALIRELEELADGDFEIDLVHAPYDEDTKGIYENFSKISGNLETSCKNIKSYIAELTDVLNKVARKDLNVEITREYVGDFTQVKESINHITDSLSEVFAEIAGATKQVQEGSTRVANTSQGLAQGASEQASAVQQISATIAEVAEQTKRNAQNANTANQISLEARTDLQTGSERMDEMVTAMQAIKEASNGIASIIKVIEDIAFQTNILALNAAVEAARAGEHGKGFAVVAEEVRSLAARSASAAKETTEMIDNSLSKVEVGSRIALETAEALEKVVKGVGNTAEIVAKIAEASAEQAASIAQINNGVDQISKVTQANTATAEESAAASQQMSGQSQVLQEMINEFEIKPTFR